MKRYDEFTRVASVSSEFVLTPDQEWTLAEAREDGAIHWGIGLWLRGNSAVSAVEIVVRVSCLRPLEGGECADCDNVCTGRTATVEMLADGQPLPLPAAQYRRVPVGAPTPESKPAAASTLLLAAEPPALAPLEHARSVKVRVCGSIVATLTAAEAANLREFMRHHRGMLPAR